MSAGLTLCIKFDGYNENGSNANPPYEGPFSLEWALQSCGGSDLHETSART
jgi:hypothetical protein